jgi:hypothetical protein
MSSSYRLVIARLVGGSTVGLAKFIVDMPNSPPPPGMPNWLWDSAGRESRYSLAKQAGIVGSCIVGSCIVGIILLL